jgi:hypothetical protein
MTSMQGPTTADEGEDDLLTRKEASIFLASMGVRLKPATLARLWSVGGDGPPCRHVRSRPFYPRGLLRIWALDQISEIRTAAPAAARARRRG